MKINRIILLFCCSCLLNHYCVGQNTLAEVVRLCPAIFHIQEDPIYLCLKYENKKKCKKDDGCSCNMTFKEILSFELERRNSYLKNYAYFFLITDKEFILKEVLPLCDEETKAALVYSYTNNNDTIFSNMIDSNNKVIIDDNAFYYPLNTKGKKMNAIRIAVESPEWFKTIMQEYPMDISTDCIIGKKNMNLLFIYIPYLR